jgi:hypothetical protein
MTKPSANGDDAPWEHELADQPALRALAADQFGGAQREALREDLVQQVDESSFSLRQWLEALLTLQAWLAARRLRLPLEEQLGYIGCAAEAAGSGAALSDLPSLVTEMLADYGCERAEPR